jgi:anti-anti-sigma factor
VVAIVMGGDAFGVLSERQCRLLLGHERVGRVAVSEDAQMAVFPVNYSVVSDEILFFTGEGTKLRAATANARVTFEVDHVDPVAETGWSVLVVGFTREVTEPDVVAGARASGLRPWAHGDRSHLVALTTEVVSGRRTGSGRERPAVRGEADSTNSEVSFVDSTGLGGYLHYEQAGACTVWRPVGELDAFSATRFRRTFVAMASAPKLIVDLADVAFVDSAGLAALIDGIRRVQELGGEVAVACRAGLKRVLHTAGLDRIVSVVASVEEAAMALGSGGAVPRPDGLSRHR